MLRPFKGTLVPSGTDATKVAVNMQNEQRNEKTNPSLEKLTADLGRHANSIHTEPRMGFKEALRLRLQEALKRPVPIMSRFKLVAVFSPVLAVLIIAVLIVQPFFGVQTVYAQDQFTLTPESSDSLGVKADGAFLLESRDSVSAADIEDLLVVKNQGNIDPIVEQISDTSVRISFAESLSSDEIIKFEIPTVTTWADGQEATRDYRWAFQVKGDFQVLYSIPADKSIGVPLDTGIEFNFNYENIEQDAFEKALTITPEIKGRIEKLRRAFVFIPEERLTPQTVYTVMLSGSLPLVGSGETLGEDITVQFETSIDEERGYSINLFDPIQTVTPTSTVLLRYSDWGNAGEESLMHVKVYRYDSFEAYVTALKTSTSEWRSYASSDTFYNVEKNDPVMEFDAERVEYDWESALLFPESLNEGYYYVDVSRNGAHAWALIQSSNLTSYVSRATNKTLVWVNDASTNTPSVGASVGYEGDEETVKTNTDGLAFTPSVSEQSDLIIVRSGDRALAVVLDGPKVFNDITRTYSWENHVPSNVSDSYWTYLYTDRPTYKPNDTVKFWGYVETRADGSRPERVSADARFDSTTVEVTPNGTYSGELVLRNSNPDYYQLNISAIFGEGKGEQTEVIASRSIGVSDYVKPAYTLSITPDIEAAFVGDSVGYTVHGEFFEGTPVKGLEVHVQGECVDQTLTLDTAGNAHGNFSCAYQSNQRYPISAWFSARPNRPEEGDMEVGSRVLIFGPKIYLDTDWESNKLEGGTGKIEVTVRNTQAINSGDPKTFAPTVRSGQSVTGTVTEITYVKRETGESYDWVRKQVVKNYEYDRIEKQINVFTILSGENGVAAYSFDATRTDANYRIDLSATDENGKTDRTTIDLWEYHEFEYGDSNALSFNNDDAGDNQWEFPGYAVGDNAHLTVYQSGKTFVLPENGRMLYYQAHQGIQETVISKSAQYVFPFEQADIPNTSVYGILYTNGAYQIVGAEYGWWYDSGGFPVRYNTELSELTIDVTPDRTVYAPGQEVFLAVKVTDVSGRPLSTEVNMNVVDEAYYAIFPENVAPLQELYRWVDDGIIATAVTKEATVSSMGAEKGGGGSRDSMGRFEFKDSAAFDLIQTDAQGNGTMKFTLPDNITSWRVTAQALQTDKKLAGNTLINIDATLPFFLHVVARDSYLDKDEPTLLVRGSGTQVGLKDAVKYTVQIPDASYKKVSSGQAGETLRIELPDLELGTHTVTIQADSGAFTDKITRQIKIVPSRLVKPVVAEITNVNASTVIDGADDHYTNVTFMEAGMGRYYGELQALSGWWGDRVDEQLARVTAATLLNDFFEEELDIAEFNESAYWNGDGVQLLPYSSGDIELTARIALLQDTPFIESDLAWYLRMRLDDTTESSLGGVQRAMAFAGLAALGEPVLAEFQRAVPDLGDDTDVQLWVALGLQGAGDDESARKIYRELLKDATSKNGYLYLKADDQETTVERTALLAVLAGGLNEPERDAIHDYVLNMNAGGTTVVLERLLYVKETLPNMIGNKVDFSYTFRGEENRAVLHRGATADVLATPEELSQFALTVHEGALMVVSRYDTPVVDLEAEVDDSLIVSRTYGNDKGTGTTFGEGDLVKVTITYDLPDAICGWDEENAIIEVLEDGTTMTTPTNYIPCETYEVTDIVLSGLTIISPNGYNSSSTECESYPSQEIDGRATFFVSTERWGGNCPSQTLTYYARVVTPGTYYAEPVYIRSTRDPETNNHSDAQTITITE